jgi:hypothetical protein
MATKRKQIMDAEKAEVTISVITPADAAAFLNANTENYRVMRENKVRKYAEDMKSGDWSLSNDAITFNGNGRLMNGQHRLRACVHANVPFPAIILRQAPSLAEVSMDTGMKRTLGDHLRARGVSNANNVASLVRLVYLFDTGAISTGGGTHYPSTVQAVEAYEADPDGMLEAAQQGARIRNASGIRPAAASLAFYVTARHDENAAQDAYAFASQFIEGTNLELGSGVLALQKWVRSALSKQHKPNTIYQAAIVLKSINSYRSGEPISVLAWKRGGATAEPFPKVWEDVDPA